MFDNSWFTGIASGRRLIGLGIQEKKDNMD